MQTQLPRAIVQPRGLGKVWSDPALRRRLMTQPKLALPEIGITVPGDVEVKTVASKGAPTDPGNATLLQFVLTRGDLLAYFFLASPLSVSAQQGAYGFIVGKSLDDPLFERYVREDAEAAIEKVCAASPEEMQGTASAAYGDRR